MSDSQNANTGINLSYSNGYVTVKTNQVFNTDPIWIEVNGAYVVSGIVQAGGYWNYIGFKFPANPSTTYDVTVFSSTYGIGSGSITTPATGVQTNPTQGGGQCAQMVSSVVSLTSTQVQIQYLDPNQYASKVQLSFLPSTNVQGGVQVSGGLSGTFQVNNLIPGTQYLAQISDDLGCSQGISFQTPQVTESPSAPPTQTPTPTGTYISGNPLTSSYTILGITLPGYGWAGIALAGILILRK